MKKTEFITAIAEKTGLPKRAVDDVLNAMIQVVRQELGAEGESILHGFGKFKIVNRKARNGRNPRTGEAIRIPEAVVRKFQITPKCTGSASCPVE